MIIFDLDGTLADCEHRRHFVDPAKRDDCVLWMMNTTKEHWIYREGFSDIKTRKKFIPDWKSFHEACDLDSPIEPVIDLWNQQISLGMMDVHQIWSGRCESVRDKTEKWLDKHLLCFNSKNLKMRPIGDYTPDDQLKERWLDEYIDSMWPKLPAPTEENKATIFHRKNSIDMVFDHRPKVVKMWRRRGVFVFDCNQTGEEF